MNTELFETPAEPLVRVTRCLSLIQPWATLMAIGAKKIETRSWGTPYRGWLAIHASKGFPRECIDLCFDSPFADVLSAAGIGTPGDLPRGQVLCVGRVVDVVSTNLWTPDPDSNEYAFGGYGPDRFGWKFEDIKRIKAFEAKGSLSIWHLPRAITQDEILP